MEVLETDIFIAGSGCAALYHALNIPEKYKVLMITKSDLESSDSFLAQGGMCMLKEESDFESYFEDTMKAGHYENDRKSVEIMIRSSKKVVEDLISFGADFRRDENGKLVFTREGGHSNHRIIFHEDVTGKEITSTLLKKVKELPNVTMMEYTTLIDIIEKDNVCYGAVIRKKDDSIVKVKAKKIILATGGVGGLYKHSTNFRHLTGDAIAIAVNHNIKLKDITYVQIHPTTLYSENTKDRRFLISESVRGEGAKLYDKNMNRFVNELLPRDLLTAAIREQMAKDGTKFVWEDLRCIPEEELKSHFINIVEYCKSAGYDVTKECIPVVPAQHYFMGGIDVDYESKTSMENLYAIGETACNGVHGKNRLASNSLLESLVFAKRAAEDLLKDDLSAYRDDKGLVKNTDISVYTDKEALDEKYYQIARSYIRKNDVL